MSSTGPAPINAVVESFFGTLKTELIHRYPWPSRRRAATAVVDYMAIFYNRKRRHSCLGYLRPADYEKVFETAALAT